MDLPELEISPSEEFKAIESAAQTGNITAMHRLAEFYEKGYGVEKNPGLSKFWREKAALSKCQK